MRNNPYTSQEDEIIISMNKAGYKPNDIAQVLLSRPESGIQIDKNLLFDVGSIGNAVLCVKKISSTIYRSATLNVPIPI